MSLQKGFLRGPQVKPDGWLIFSGIILSSVISFCFYAFFVYISEVYRSTLTEFTDSLLLLDSKDVRFFGYSLALLASVIGQGFGLKLILSAISRNQSFKSRFGLRLNIHNIRFTLWFWLFWVCNWLGLIGITYTSLAVQYELDIRAEVGYLFFLLPLVWFLNYWLSAYRIFQKRKRLQYIIGAFLYLCASTLIIGNVRLVDYEQLNDIYSGTFPEYSYNMQLPESRTQLRIRSRRLSEKVYLIWDGVETKVLFHESDLTPFGINDPLVPEKINQIKQSFSEVEQDRVRFIITADTRIPTSSVLAFEHILSTNGIERVLYRTSVKNSKYPWHFPAFQRTGLPKLISPECPVARKTLDNFKQAGYQAYQIEWPDFGCYRLMGFVKGNRVLVKVDSGGLRLNGTPIEEQELLNILTKLIAKYEGNLNVLYQPHPDVGFAAYLKGRDIIFQSYIANRKKYALAKYGLEYEYTDGYRDPRLSDQYREIQWTYPVAILELTGWNLEFYKYLKD